MFYIVQPYGPSGDYGQASVVASFDNAEAARAHLDGFHAQMASMDVPMDAVELVVVDEHRKPVQRPIRSIQ